MKARAGVKVYSPYHFTKGNTEKGIVNTVIGRTRGRRIVKSHKSPTYKKQDYQNQGQGTAETVPGQPITMDFQAPQPVDDSAQRQMLKQLFRPCWVGIAHIAILRVRF
jgi:hypothetical protein